MKTPIKYVADKNGNVMRAEDFLKREAKEWFGAFKTLFKECADTGKQFTKENAEFIEGLAGKPKRRK